MGSVKKVVDVSNNTKFGQTEADPTFVAIGENALLQLDSRVNSKNSVVESKNYKTKTKFSSLTTTNSGGIAVGSKLGDIRMFGTVGKNAKTLLKGFGDAITSIDATADGRWVLATTDSYLLLVLTVCKTDKTGFETSMGSEKPRPIILRLNPFDVRKFKLNPVKLQSAKFNLTNKRKEYSIVASTGSHLIEWNFSKIRMGIYDEYQVIPTNDRVIKSEFKCDADEIVVTLDKKLRIHD